MKRMKKLLGLTLAGALVVSLMAGCSPKIDPNDIAYKTAGISRDTVMYTMDGVDVTADEYLFWLLSSIIGQMQYGGLATDEAWAEEIDGTPAADYLKNDALEASKLYIMVAKKAADAGVTLSEEDQTAANDQIDQAAASAEAQGGNFQEWLDQQCISEATFRKFNNVYYLNQNLMAKLQEDGELTPTDEKMADFLNEIGYYNVKHILLSTKNDDNTSFSDEEKAAVKAEAEALLAEIRASANPEATFDEKMNARSDDTRDAEGKLNSPDGYLSYPGQMMPAFETASQALSVGEISDLVETDYGYHIILRLSADTDETREVYPRYAMSKLTEQWMEEAKIETTEAYQNLDPKAFYEALKAFVEERNAAKEAAATPSPTGTVEPTTTPKTEN